jgi:hypothetical protein
MTNEIQTETFAVLIAGKQSYVLLNNIYLIHQQSSANKLMLSQ